MHITSYLIFNGEAGEAAGFYAEVLGGTVENLYRYEDMPPTGGMPEIPADCKRRIMHCCVAFPGGSMSLADTLPSDPRDFGNGGFMLTLNCDSIEQAEQVYDGIRADAREVVCEMGETFYAKRYAEVVDRFGVRWAVMYEER